LTSRTAELHENQERYALVSQAVAEGIYDWDIENNALWVSPRLIEIFGLQGLSLSAADWNARVHPDDFEDYRAALRDCFKGTTARLACEYRIRLTNGEYRWVEDHGLPIRGAAERVVRLVGAVNDITERKEAEQALRESLDQQTATAEVLQVINSSPGALAPVFDVMLDKATHLCEAEIGVLWTYSGEQMEASAILGAPPRYAEFLRRGARPLSPTHLRLQRGEPVIQIVDVPSYDGYLQGLPLARALFDLGRVRTILMVPLRKDEAVLGAFAVYRREVRPFSDKQTALLQNFAAQAVIAMENARLITETREALEQQTATAEVLGVINSSPGDLTPVFQAILEKAHALCKASFGALMTYDGERFYPVAHQGTPAPFREFIARGIQPQPGDPFGRMVEEAPLSHIHDLLEIAKQYPTEPLPRAAVDLGGIRTLLVVPLRKDATLLGAITAYRQDVNPFTDKQIALLQNFAAQAVIAMENARLLTETREALEQQTATAEVLQVINSSPGELGPVFDAILDKAMLLCEVAFGELHTFDGNRFYTAALHGLPPPYAEIRAKTSLSGLPGTTSGRILETKLPVHHLDLAAEETYQAGVRTRRDVVDLGGARTGLGIPLLKGNKVVGVIICYRQEVQPFTDKQIALLENFAAQAVIAMENARLINETREALEQQTATAEVLQVINSSPGDLAPVFDAMLEKAMRLCGAAFGFMTIIDGERSRTVAARGVPEAYAAFRERNPTPATAPIASRVRKGEPFIHTVDLKAERFYGEGDPQRRAIVDLGGARTLLAAPLMRDQAVLGAIQVYRTEVRSFSDKQIALLQNFAAQAVIAMENARLLTETREALDRQTATAEVLQVINSSPGDLAPVYDVILEKARSLCGVAVGGLTLYDGKHLRAVTVHGFSQQFVEEALHPFRPGPAHKRLICGERLVHIPDFMAVASESTHSATRALVEMGVRTTLLVPLRKDSALLGYIAANRLAGCGKSRDFGKMVMKRARSGNPGLIKSTGYEGAKTNELGWKQHRPTFSAAC